jgi:imidazolonepropionase
VTSLVVRNAGSVVTFPGEGPLRGEAMRAPDVVGGATIVCEGDRIAAIDSAGEGDEVVDASGCTVIPGLVDCHTHLPFFGWRADEDVARLSGVRYETLHQEEGGIFRSRRMLAEAADDDVIAFGARQADEMLRSGTTTFEMKSGYGLSVEAELRQLRLARRLGEVVAQRTVTTCLAAHAVPEERSQGQWIGEAVRNLLPVVAEEGLASACDIYVERIAFGLEHAARLSEAAKGLGLAMRVHADQLADNQAGSFAGRKGFRSADHLNHTTPDAVQNMAQTDTAAVLLPGATFTLRQSKKPPAEELVRAGAIVALGTDLNPGTSPVSSMLFVMALACRLYGLRPEEALAAATVNSAYVLGLDRELGRVAPGFRADLVILDAPSFDHVTYRPDAQHVRAVVCAGRVVYASG